MYQFSRSISSPNPPIKEDLNFPERKELGQFANLMDSKIRINLLVTSGASFVIKSDTTIYKDNNPVTEANAEKQNIYEITYKDIGSTFISFSFIFLNDKPISKVLKVEKKDDTNFYLVANIPLIFYLAGVLSAEMGKSFPEEALKAQAVASRTYLYASGFLGNQNNINSFSSNGSQNLLSSSSSSSSSPSSGSPSNSSPLNSSSSNNSVSSSNGSNTGSAKKPYDIENSVNFQVFSFNNIEYFLPIVAQTDNLVLKYDGQVFPTYFHSHSGGILTTPALVWGKNLPYLSNVYKVKEDIYSKDSYKWNAQIGRFFLKTLFSRAGFDVDGYCSNIEILSIGEDKRISKIKISFSNGKVVELTGDAFRKVVGTTVIKSTNFSFTYDATSQNYIFNGVGYGHGIGLSQFGAKAMAESSFTFDKILSFYYNNATISQK
jgi:SpoIID/LytB domain protein